MKVTYENIEDLKIRTIRNPIQKDTRNPCSLDDAIVTVSRFDLIFIVVDKLLPYIRFKERNYCYRSKMARESESYD